MAVEASIFYIKEKLRILINGNKTIDPIRRGADKIHVFIGKLSEVQDLLKNDSSHGSLNPELLKAVYLAEDAIDTFIATFQKDKTLMQLKNSVCTQPFFLCKMEKLVGEISKQSSIKQGKPSLSNFGPAEQPHRIFNGLSDRMEDLPEQILNVDPSLFHISVVECDSQRKTLSRIYSYEDVKKHFECRAWVRVSEEFEKRHLLLDIFKQVTGKSEGMENLQIDSLQHDLRNLLIKKRYLVVLTDVRTPDIWEILKFALPNSSNGSRVIFSFREADAKRYPNIRFFGREASLISKLQMQVPSNESKDVGADTATAEQVESKDVEADTAATEQVVKSNELFDYLDKKTDIVGMRDEILKLAKLTLTSRDKYFPISVVGVEGSGKTTLVKTIYNYPCVRKTFDCRAWANVDVSQYYDTRSMLIDILKQVKEDYIGGPPLDQVERDLTEVLSKKRFLIVLDDVNLPGAWYDLQRIFPSSLSGSRVILITSDASVAQFFSRSIVILKLSPLKIDDNWKLFLKKARTSPEDGSKPDLTNIRETIWEKCHGLPLAICVLGGLFSCKDRSEWLKVIEQILPGGKKKDGVVEHNDQKDTSVSDENAAFDEDQSISTDKLGSLDKLGHSYIWALGYKDLSPHLKDCLDYTCLFPKSYEIPVRRLFHLWLAVGLETPREGREISPEDCVNRDFEELEKRNMIEVAKWRSDGIRKTYRVPSSLYDTICPKVEEMGSVHVHRKIFSTSNSPESCIRWLAEHVDIQYNPPSDKCIQNLHSYISFIQKGDKPNREIGDFLEKKIIRKGFGLLRVLDLEHVYKPVLPETLGKLRLLRYIGLRWTFLDSIPMSIGDLQCLETLDVKHTNITSLPLSIWRIKTLRHLYLNEIHFQMSKQKSFCPLFNLQTLKQKSFCPLFNLQTLKGLFIGIDCPPMDWLNRLSSVNKLGVTCLTESLGEITKWIQDLTSLKSLKLRSVNGFSEPSEFNLNFMDMLNMNLTELYLLGKLPRYPDISQHPPNLKILTLSMSKLWNDPMPILGNLNNLNVLRLFADSYIGEEMTCLQGGFPELRVLKLWLLKDLRIWTIKNEAMPKLKELEIRYCEKLEKPNGLEHVSTLEELILTNMKKAFVDEVKNSLVNNTVTTVNNWDINPPWD